MALTGERGGGRGAILGGQRFAAAERPLAHPIRALARTLAAEQDRWFLWAPICLGAGIGLYFSLGVEPPALVGAGALAVAIGLTILARAAGPAWPLSLALVLAALGYVLAQARAHSVAAPVLEQPMRQARVVGHIASIEARGRDHLRVVVHVTSIAGLAPADTPAYVRVRTPLVAAGPAVADGVEMVADLLPPPIPALPGDYDFARRAWFQQIGAVGSAHVRPQAVDAGEAPLSLRLWAPIENLRRRVAERIHAVLDGDRAAIATALIQGDQGGISQATMQIMRDSGLVHILSISGLHMALMAGALFWIVRAVLCLSPTIAQTWPVRAIAAIAASLGALLYLLLSGCQIPAVRAFIMIEIMFLAVIAGRSALSLRNVALAGLVMLLARPENMLDVGFLMSFAATAGLVALYEELAARRNLDREPAGGARGSLRWVGRIVAADVATTFVAGLAVAPLGIYYFHKMQQYSVLANLLAMPIVSFWLMPLVLVTLVAMPFGLEAWPLQGMAHGIDALIVIARWVAALPGAVTAVPAIPQTALLLIMIGLLWLVLWRQSWRWLGLVAIGAGVVTAGLHERPDALVGRGARLVAVRADGGLLAVSPGRGSIYEIERWLEHDGDRHLPAQARVNPGVVCRDGLCRSIVRGWRLAHVLDERALPGACDGADIVVSAVRWERPCGGGILMLDAEDTRHAGTHALTLRPGAPPVVTTVAQSRGQRPWTGAASDSSARPLSP